MYDRRILEVDEKDGYIFNP